MMASSVAAVVFLGAVISRVETKEPTTTTAVTINEACRDEPFTPPSDPRPREGEGKGARGRANGGVFNGS
jgi:hypothetical protein